MVRGKGRKMGHTIPVWCPGLAQGGDRGLWPSCQFRLRDDGGEPVTPESAQGASGGRSGGPRDLGQKRLRSAHEAWTRSSPGWGAVRGAGQCGDRPLQPAVSSQAGTDRAAHCRLRGHTALTRHFTLEFKKAQSSD